MVRKVNNTVINYIPFDASIDAWIDEQSDGIIDAVRGLLQIPSVKGQPEPGAPFGIETRRALDFALDCAQSEGLDIKILDGFAGHAEWIPRGATSSSEIVGVLAHVDVVPEGNDWKHAPFGAEVDCGKVYGRGAIDDKGPAMAALFAILALKATNIPGKRRIRWILGADEESDFGCVAHYFANEEMPVMGFTPDADFPLVYAEKGICDVVLQKFSVPVGEQLHVRSMNGGRRSNMVPDYATAVLTQKSTSWAPIVARLNAVLGVKTQVIENGTALEVIATGISAHGSTPDLGLNAIVVLCDALLLLDHHEDQTELVSTIRRWGEDTSGKALCIDGFDDIAGSLTSNLGIINFAEGSASLTFNIRYPVSWTGNDVQNKLESGLTKAGFVIASVKDTAPLYVPEDDPLVKSLLEVYRNETGDQRRPMTIGGGTYARVMKKGVAFGPEFPGNNSGAHQADESWAIADLIRAVKIYAKALLRLVNV